MISPKLFRYFSYRPGSKLHFEGSRSLLMKSSEKKPITKFLNVASVGIPSLMLLRIISKYAIMGSFNFGFSTLILVGTVYLSKAWIKFSKNFIDEIYLMKSGKSIEIVSQGLFKESMKIKICDIINPEENLQTKLKIMHFGAWILETRKGESFYIMQNREVFSKDVLKHVFHP